VANPLPYSPRLFFPLGIRINLPFHHGSRNFCNTPQPVFFVDELPSVSHRSLRLLANDEAGRFLALSWYLSVLGTAPSVTGFIPVPPFPPSLRTLRHLGIYPPFSFVLDLSPPLVSAHHLFFSWRLSWDETVPLFLRLARKMTVSPPKFHIIELEALFPDRVRRPFPPLSSFSFLDFFFFPRRCLLVSGKASNLRTFDWSDLLFGPRHPPTHETGSSHHESVSLQH